MSRSALMLATLLGTTALVLAACKKPREGAQANATTSSAPPVAAHRFEPAISSSDFAAHVRLLASDAFEGRAPGSAGGDKSVEYIKAQFLRLGLAPGNGDSYIQSVPMVEAIADPATVLAFDVGGKPLALRFGSDMVVGTRSGQAQVVLDGSDLVFVGYGVHAPELGWNDYAGTDVRGKTVVMFVNDPGFHVQDPTLFGGKRMTYYGRWTYKFEEAARQGAAAALIIHDREGAAYGWDVVKDGWSGPQFALSPTDDREPRLRAQGWLSGGAANTLLGRAGHRLDALYEAANMPGFKAIPLQAKLSLDLRSTITRKTSRNVLARLPGAERPDEAIVYMAHWDHLGRHEGERSHGGDRIYNGAVDNATGVAGMLEIAEAFSRAGTPPDRSLLFLAVTLEESGLLGSRYYVAHPSVPLAQTVAVVNLDTMPVIGRTRDMTVVGLGSSQLEAILRRSTDAQGRVLRAEASPQDGLYFRSDHFNFAKAGVPALYAKGGDDLIDGGTGAGKAAQVDYRDNRYHQPGDAFDPAWPLAGVVEDIHALYGVGRELAGSGQWPVWYPGSPFAAAHAKLHPAAP